VLIAQISEDLDLVRGRDASGRAREAFLSLRQEREKMTSVYDKQTRLVAYLWDEIKDIGDIAGMFQDDNSSIREKLGRAEQTFNEDQSTSDDDSYLCPVTYKWDFFLHVQALRHDTYIWDNTERLQILCTRSRLGETEEHRIRCYIHGLQGYIQ